MSKYSQIQNLAELNSALAESAENLARKERQLKKRYEKARGFYTPSAFVAEGTRKLVSNLPLTDIALFFIRRIRKRLR